MEDYSTYTRKTMETKSLQNFTIPKIRRSFDKACLVRCMASRREYTDIQNTLNGARLDIGCELTNYWKIEDAKLVTNSDLEKRFLLKRSEMRDLGRHGRELEVNFCYLVLSRHSAMNICGHGLNTNNLPSKLLGNPLMGVYLFRHIDVALNFSKQNGINDTTIVIFKVLFGKIKKVHTNMLSKMKAALDPTPNYDCHMSKKAPTLSDPLEEQIANSLVYLYEYDMSVKAVEKPRHCLPYAMVSATFLALKPVTVLSPIPLKVHHKHFSIGKEKLMNCTVAKRIGKGKDATIIYENIQVRAPMLESPLHTKEISRLQCTEKGGLLSTNNTVGCFGNSVPSNLCHNLGPAYEKNVSPQNGIFKAIETTCPVSKETAELEYAVSTSMVITSKSIKDPRLLKRTEQDVSKPVHPHLIAQLQTDLLSQNDILSDSEKCVYVGELDPTLEDLFKTNSLYLSFEEARLSHEQFRKKDTTLSYFVEPCNMNRQSKTEYLQRTYDNEGSEISKQSAIHTHSYNPSLNQLENEKEEQPPVYNSLAGEIQGCQKSMQSLFLNTSFEDVLQKEEPGRDKQHVFSRNYGPNNKANKRNIRKTCEQQDYLDENKMSELSPARSNNLRNTYTKSAGDLKNNTSASLEATQSNSTDGIQDTILTKNGLAKKDLLERNSSDTGGKERNSSDTGGKITVAPYTDVCKSEDGSSLANKEHCHEEITVAKVSTHPLKEGKFCSRANEPRVSSCIHNFDQEGLERTSKEDSYIKEFESKRSARQPEKTVPKNHIRSVKQTIDESQSALNGRKEKFRNEIRDKKNTSHQTKNSNIVTTSLSKQLVQMSPNKSETKIQDTVLIKKQLLSPHRKSGSLAIRGTIKNDFKVVACKGDFSQFPVSEIENADDKATITNNDVVVSGLEDGSLSKTIAHENNLLPKNDDDVNIPCEIENVSLQPIKPKALTSNSKIGNLSSQINDIEMQGGESAGIKHLEVGMKQMLTLASDACIINPSEELSDLQTLESRIDWYGLFGSDGLVTEHCNPRKSSPQLYFYKAKKEKEMGGLRIFPDMQISVRNTIFETMHTPLEIHISQEKQTSFISENYSKKCNDPVSQVPRKVVAHSTNACENLQTSIKKVNLEANDVYLAIAEAASQSDEKDDMDSTSRTSSKTSHKTAYVNSENKQPRVALKKKILGNKKRPKFVFKRSVGRIKKFSQSEENIKSVLNMLSDEATSCKSKRISKKLDRAILHLRKAHKRVQKSLQLVERRNLGKSPSAVDSSGLEASGPKHSPSKDNVPAVNIKILQGDIDVKKLVSNACESNSESKPEKPIPMDTKGSLSKKGVNGLSKRHPQTKASSLSPSLLCTSVMKRLSSSCNRNNSSPEHFTSLSACKQSNKENTVPLSFSQTPEKEKLCVEQWEAVSVINDTDLAEKDPLSATTVTKLNVNETSNTDQLNDEVATKTQYVPLKVERKSAPPMKQLSRLLRDADETDCLRSLHQCRLMCENMLPTFIKTFEKKQNCSFTDVLVDRKSLVKRNIQVSFKNVLRPCAIEEFIELQMVLEAIQFIDNRIHYLQKEPTFRSLLWYDSTLYMELIAGESGFQQQSHLYRAFQEKLKFNALSTLQNHHAQLCDVLQSIHEKKSSYYVFLKYRREIEECEAVLNNCCDHSEFSLSVPLSCGVHIGDSIEDLGKLQQNTFELIKNFAILPKCDPGKQEHALYLLEIISAKIDLIKSSRFIPMQLSLFGIEHLLFDAAKRSVLKQQSCYTELKKTSCVTKEFRFSVNHYALSKLYEIYGTPSEEILPVQQTDGLHEQQTLNKDLYFHPQHHVSYVGKIIDQARCAEPHLLKQMIHDCKQHLETLLKYFQVLQECDANQTIITRSNVFASAQKEEQLKILLKPEAVETYIEIGMTYETLHFLRSLMASQKKKIRFRGLLYYDNSLFDDLIKSQCKMISYLQGDFSCKAVEVIDNTISDIKSELEIISDFSESVNYTYALQIMTRELSELSELKNFILDTKSEINTYIHFSPFVASAHFGNTSSELDHNYNQFSDLLDILMSAPKRDLGKMAHTIKVMKTIEMMKSVVVKKSTIEILICQMEAGSCNVDVKENEMNKNNADQSPRKRDKSRVTMSDQEMELQPKKIKVNLQSTSSSITEEEETTGRIRAKGDDADNQRSTNNVSLDSQGSDNMDLECPNSEGQGTEDGSYLHQGQHNSNWSSQSLIPLNASNSQLLSTYPWYSLYFWYQNENTGVTQSYQGESYNMQQSIPHSGPFSMQNSYATNQPYCNTANQIQSSHLPTSAQFTTGMTYNYSTPPSPFLYDPSSSGVWSWGQ